MTFSDKNKKKQKQKSVNVKNYSSFIPIKITIITRAIKKTIIKTSFSIFPPVYNFTVFYLINSIIMYVEDIFHSGG